MTTDDFDFDQALEAVVSRTGVERYRYLTREHPDPAVRESYSGWVLREARGEPHPAQPPVRVSYGDPPPGGAACCGG